MPRLSSDKSSRTQNLQRRYKHTVLWVDDDPYISAAIARRMKRRAIRVIPASDGMQGYWLALTRRPDVVVTDLRMPRWQGEDLVECLTQNKATCGLPTIVLSGYSSDLDSSYVARHGISEVLNKPVDFDDLICALNRCWKTGRRASSDNARGR